MKLKRYAKITVNVELINIDLDVCSHHGQLEEITSNRRHVIGRQVGLRKFNIKISVICLYIPVLSYSLIWRNEFFDSMVMCLFIQITASSFRVQGNFIYRARVDSYFDKTPQIDWWRSTFTDCSYLPRVHSKNMIRVACSVSLLLAPEPPFTLWNLLLNFID